MVFKSFFAALACTGLSLFLLPEVSGTEQPPVLQELAEEQPHTLLDTPQAFESIDISLTMTDAFLYEGEDAGLMLCFTLRGGWPDGAMVEIETLMLDDTALTSVYLPGNLNASGAEVQLTLKIKKQYLQYSRITHFSHVRLFLSLNGIRSVKKGAWFDFDLPTDLTMVTSHQPETSRPMAEFEQNGVVFELLRLSEDASGNLICDMHIANNSGCEKRITDIHGSVNGIHLPCEFPPLVFFSPMVLPPESECWFPILFYAYSYEPDEPERILSYDLSDIRHMELNVQVEDSISFQLSETPETKS